jgi:enamine deaminase RidA (YjgF/YER057c/UK114 family)
MNDFKGQPTFGSKEPHQVRNTADKTRIKKTAIENRDVLCEAYDYPKKVSFTRGMRVELDKCVMLFISGTASVGDDGESLHPGDIEAQTRRTFHNITGLLAAEGADWHDIVRTTCYLADFRYYDPFNEVRNAFYSEQELNPLPASTCIEARICRPELLVEIEAIAMIPKERGK